jgi:hypothetical protein
LAGSSIIPFIIPEFINSFAVTTFDCATKYLGKSTSTLEINKICKLHKIELAFRKVRFHVHVSVQNIRAGETYTGTTEMQVSDIFIHV